MSHRIAPAAEPHPLHQAQEAAHEPGEYAGQQSFMRASEIRALARRAGIEEGSSLLDVCCGIGGPGRLITRELGCRYLGIDRDPDAIRIARDEADGLPCRFEVGDVPPLPPGTFDVVLLLETLLAFADKESLFQAVAGALGPGGRFAFTAEVGHPLTVSEREEMPNAHTVWPIPLADLRAHLVRAGLAVRWVSDCTVSHSVTAASLLTAYTDDAEAIGPEIGEPALSDLLAAHRLWAQWLDSGRVRKVAVVAERLGAVTHLPLPSAGT